MKILIIEDEPQIANQLGAHLKQAGFVPHVVHDGNEARFAGDSAEYDAIVLDLGLPGVDGTTLLREWRAGGVTTPVIVLTARTSKQDIVNTLEAGADDFVTKPFDLDEVAARVRVAIRRTSHHADNLLSCGDVRIDTGKGRVHRDGVLVTLTRTEYLLVQYLFTNQGRVVSISEIADHIYDDFDHDSGIIQRHIANVRKKLGKDTIRTETNRGYLVPECASGD